MDPLRSQTGTAREAVNEAMAASFQARSSLADGDVTAAAQDLAATRCADPAWTARVP